MSQNPPKLKKFCIWYNFMTHEGDKRYTFNKHKIIKAINIKTAHLKFYGQSKSESVYIVRTEINEKSGIKL